MKAFLLRDLIYNQRNTVQTYKILNRDKHKQGLLCALSVQLWSWETVRKGTYSYGALLNSSPRSEHLNGSVGRNPGPSPSSAVSSTTQWHMTASTGEAAWKNWFFLPIVRIFFKYQVWNIFRPPDAYIILKKINFMELLHRVACLLMPGYILVEVKDLEIWKCPFLKVRKQNGTQTGLNGKCLVEHKWIAYDVTMPLWVTCSKVAISNAEHKRLNMLIVVNKGIRLNESSIKGLITEFKWAQSKGLYTFCGFIIANLIMANGGLLLIPLPVVHKLDKATWQLQYFRVLFD